MKHVASKCCVLLDDWYSQLYLSCVFVISVSKVNSFVNPRNEIINDCIT